MLGIEGETVVPTGAFGAGALARCTGTRVFNAGCAVGAVQYLAAGVCSATNGCLYEAEKTGKNYQTKQFQNINF